MCRLYFSDLIKDVDVEKCVEEFLVRCDDAPDIDALREALYQMIDARYLFYLCECGYIR